MGGGGATRTMRRWPWDIAFTNARQGSRKARNPKPSHHAQFQVCCIKQQRREVVSGGGVTRMMRWWPWDIAFANARQGRGRRDGNPKPSCRAQFPVHCIKQQWREMLGGGGAACTM